MGSVLLYLQKDLVHLPIGVDMGDIVLGGLQCLEVSKYVFQTLELDNHELILCRGSSCFFQRFADLLYETLEQIQVSDI